MVKVTPHYITTQGRMLETLKQLKHIVHQETMKSKHVAGFVNSSLTVQEKLERKDFVGVFSDEIINTWFNIMLQAFGLFDGSIYFPYLKRDLTRGLHTDDSEYDDDEDDEGEDEDEDDVDEAQ